MYVFDTKPLNLDYQKTIDTRSAEASRLEMKGFSSRTGFIRKKSFHVVLTNYRSVNKPSW